MAVLGRPMPGLRRLTPGLNRLTPDLRRVTPGLPRDGWENTFWVWDLQVAGLAILLVAVGLDRGALAGQRGFAAAALGLLAVWYLVFGRRVILVGKEDDAQSWLFVAGVLVLFGVAVGFDEVSWFALFVITPMVFLCLSLRRSVPVVAVLHLLPPAVVGLRHGSAQASLMAVPTAVLTLTFALMLGTFVARTVRRSSARAELIRELEASRAEVARLSHTAGVSAERVRLAGEIHDTLAQGFASIITLVQAAEADVGRDEARVRRRLDLAVRTARENLAEARDLVHARAPQALASGSLDEAVRRLAERTGEELAVPVEFQVDGAARPMPTAVEVVLLRAAQEGLSNVRKHAAASAVTVRLSYRDGSIGLLVRDDGKGFREDGVAGGFGLAGMRRRAEQVGGSLSIHSTASAGTAIEVEVPL